MFLILMILATNCQQYEVTAYCPCIECCGTYADGITASGHVLSRYDKVIAAPVGIKFGTKFYIPKYGVGTVHDRGGAIKGNRLDIFFNTHERALQWGRQELLCLKILNVSSVGQTSVMVGQDESY